MTRRTLGPREVGSLGVLVLLAPLAIAAAGVVVEDWSAAPLGARGLPAGWQRQSWGTPRYDFTIVDDGGHRALHLRSHDENSTITKALNGQVSLAQTPILEWSWKAVALPPGGEARHGATDDEGLQIYVDWPRFPQAV